MANNPNSPEKIAARKAARKASGMSAQKFYVTTRLAEAAKSGKTLDRAALRKKFQSGDVARKGFAAPKKKTGGSGSSSTGSSSSSKTSSSYTPGMGGNPKTNATGSTSKLVGAGDAALDPLKYMGRRATQNMKGVSGYKSGNVQKSTKPLYLSFGGSTKESKAADKAKKIADRGAKYKSDQAKKKSDYDNSPRQKAYKATLAASNAKRDKSMSDYRAKQDTKMAKYKNSDQQKSQQGRQSASDAKQAKKMADYKAKQDAKKKKK